MAVRQILITAIVLLSLSRIDRRRAKAITRQTAVRGCRFVLDWLSPRYVPRDTPCIVFAPHQDDETLGCGALIARKRREGLPVHVVFITDGSASHAGHPELTPAAISALRRREALDALAILGVESEAIHFLDEADGTLNNLPPARQERLIAQFTALLTAIGPGEVFLPCSPDGSSEHDAAFGFICAALLRSRLRPDVWQYPVWSWWNPRLLVDRMVFTAGRCTLATEDYRPIKALALSRYHSQIEPLPPWRDPALPPELVRFFHSDREYFFRFVLPPPGCADHGIRVI